MSKRESCHNPATPLLSYKIKNKKKPVDEREKAANIQLRPYFQQKLKN